MGFTTYRIYKENDKLKIQLIINNRLEPDDLPLTATGNKVFYIAANVNSTEAFAFVQNWLIDND